MVVIEMQTLKKWVIYYKIPLITLFLVLSALSIMFFLSFNISATEATKKGNLDIITTVEITQDEYVIEDILLIDKALISNSDIPKIIESFNRQNFYATSSELDKYVKITANKAIAAKDISTEVNVYPIVTLKLLEEDGYSKLEGNMNIQLPAELSKHESSVNAILRLKSVTGFVDSTGIINNNTAIFNYNKDRANYVTAVFKKPYVLHMPFFSIKRIWHLLLYLFAAGVLFFIIYLAITKTIALYREYRNRPIVFNDVEYANPGSSLNNNNDLLSRVHMNANMQMGTRIHNTSPLDRINQYYNNTYMN